MKNIYSNALITLKIFFELLSILIFGMIIFLVSSIISHNYPLNNNLIIYTDGKENIDKEKIKEFYYNKGASYVNVEVGSQYCQSLIEKYFISSNTDTEEKNCIKISYNIKKNEYISPPIKGVKEVKTYPSLFFDIKSFFILSIFHLLLLIWGSFRFINLKLEKYSKDIISLIIGLAIIIPTLVFNFLYGTILEKLFKYEFNWGSLFIDENVNIFLSFLFIVILGPIAEEIYFRGYILNEIKDKINLKFAFFYSSILFAIVHYNFPYFIGYFVIGYFLAFSYKISKSILIPILIHIINNLIFYMYSISQ